MIIKLNKKTLIKSVAIAVTIVLPTGFDKIK